MRQPPSQTPPLLSGPDDVVEGYYELEDLERGMTLTALRQHRDLVPFWYRGLTLYRRGMMGEWEYPVSDPSQLELMVWGLRGQLLGLGVSSAKSALDLLLAGYYSVAFAAIRHMIESFIQYLYVGVNPNEAKLWYRQPGGLVAQKDPPGCSAMCKAIKKHPAGISFRAAVNKAYRSWRLMCKGAHPSGEGLTQTATDDQARFNFGATYSSELGLVGFDHGLYAVDLLLLGLLGVRVQDDSWEADYEAWRQDVAQWRAAQRALLMPGSASATAPS